MRYSATFRQEHLRFFNQELSKKRRIGDLLCASQNPKFKCIDVTQQRNI